MSSPEAAQGRLVWRCRRGMKELDLVLTRYLRERWPAADTAERAQFEQILDLPDPELAGYLLGREQHMDSGLQQMVEYLRGGLPRAVAPAATASTPGPTGS